MKKVIALILIVAILGVGMLFRAPIQAVAYDLAYYSPCDTPIEYSIGVIDSRFKTTRENLIEDARIAANIWNSTQNKQLLRYNPDSSFTINMVYDSRQELTSKINDLNSDLEKQQNSIDPEVENYKEQQRFFESKVQKLNEDVAYWNAQGGAPKEEYEALIARQQELKNEADRLNAIAKSLGQKTSEYNLNAQRLNQTIDDYQEVLEVRPEEGLYEQKGNKRKISLYIDVNHDEFLHTLTHEFGHALGLAHTNNKESIMYFQTNDVLAPSDEEIAQLNEICEPRTIAEVGYSRLQDLAVVLSERLASLTDQKPGK